MATRASETKRRKSSAPACARSSDRSASWAHVSGKRRSSRRVALTRGLNRAESKEQMAEFNIRTDAVDVEQIMRQIRARIQSKRGVDYTEEQIQELANVKLERFLDPKGVRSDLVEQFRRVRDFKLEPFQLDQELRTGFDAEMLYGTHRGILRTIRRLLNPILKLFFNPGTLIHA